MALTMPRHLAYPTGSPEANVIRSSLFLWPRHNQLDHAHRAKMFDTLNVQPCAFHILDRATIDIRAIDTHNQRIQPIHYAPDDRPVNANVVEQKNPSVRFHDAVQLT